MWDMDITLKEITNTFKGGGESMSFLSRNVYFLDVLV
jgi:hypothetical protein